MVCGTRWRKITLASEAPASRAASMNSRERSERTCARTIREVVSHEIAPNPTNRSGRVQAGFPPNHESNKRTNRIDGIP